MKNTLFTFKSALVFAGIIAAFGAGFLYGGKPEVSGKPTDYNPLERNTHTIRTAVNWQDLSGLRKDNLTLALPALTRSCEVFLKRPPNIPYGQGENTLGTAEDWWPFCTALKAQSQLADVSEVSIYSLLETHLQPYLLEKKNPYLAPVLSPFGLGGVGAKSQGLFTGYYEPEIKGSMERTETYSVPLYGLPDDHLTAQLGDFYPEMAGKKVTARAENGRLKPYHTRAEIDTGVIGPENILLWLQDPVDKFFLQIQGSGRVILPDGSQVFAGYAGVNGHPYTAIGRYLVQEGYMDLDDVSMQSIRQWLEANPDKRQKVLHQNESYVFFTLRPDGPYGTQGVLLTPNRSLAVDRRAVPLGTPVFLKTDVTATSKPFEKLMVAQDTGGAIKGVIRGDIYFGHGSEAAYLAGKQKSDGQLFMLLPKEISVTNNQ